MDVEHDAVQPCARRANPYKTAPLVQSSVLSNKPADTATIDGGFRCIPMDDPASRPVLRVPAGATDQFLGDQFGKRRLARKPDSLQPGSQIELVMPHCDRTVSLQRVYHCVRGDTLVDIWPVDTRGSP